MKNKYIGNDIVLKNWNDDFNGIAIYSLVDENGKRYIGKTKQLNRRLKTHQAELTRVYYGLFAHHEGFKLVQAVKEGHKFHVEILKKYDNITHNELCEQEKYYFYHFGGIKNTYNSTFPTEPNYLHEPYNKKILKTY